MIDKTDLLQGTANNELALYVNIPYCLVPCTYCHYKNNIEFGKKRVPDAYFRLLCQDIVETCTPLRGINLRSIYFGGGTPSLLSSEQIANIRLILNELEISADEVSMELHPGMINFRLEGDEFFTRFSLGMQSFSQEILKSYHRKGYDVDSVRDLIKLIRQKTRCQVINIDLLMERELPAEDTVTLIEDLNPDSVSIYPHSQIKGVDRLRSVLLSLKSIKAAFHAYRPLFKSNTIFIKNSIVYSLYTKVEYETFGDIYACGNNSVSYIGDNTYLTRYENGHIHKILRKERGKRYIISFLRSLPTGVSYQSVKNLFPQLLKSPYLHLEKTDQDLADKHCKPQLEDLVYLPETEYIPFYINVLSSRLDAEKKAFLSIIGNNDFDEKVNFEVFNKSLLLVKSERDILKNYIPNGVRIQDKLKTPSFHLLIEGIDGSGKDTFVSMLTQELKKRFYYDDDSRISVSGQPNSSLPFGIMAKTFIETGKFTTKQEIYHALRENRIASEKMIAGTPGIYILVRGIVTDQATCAYFFPESGINLGEKAILPQWDWLVIVDCEPEIADGRIGRRGGDRTWREHLGELTYFRDFYLGYKNSMFKEKIIVGSTSLSALQNMAERLANDIYSKALAI